MTTTRKIIINIETEMGNSLYQFLRSVMLRHPIVIQDLDSLIKDSEKGRFYCNWCGEMKPIEERREITDETEYVTWLGCGDCYKKKVRLDNVTE